MDTFTFDAVTRGVARARTRRSALGLLAGALLATAVHPAGACKPGHDCRDGKGGNDDNKKDERKDEKQCRREAHRCAGHWGNECVAAYPHDAITAALCTADFQNCCSLARTCNKRKASACIEATRAQYSGDHGT
jgi:hypothetical protein